VTRPAEESGELGAASVVVSVGVSVVVVGGSVVVGSSVVVVGSSVVVVGSSVVVVGDSAVVVGGSVVGGSVVGGVGSVGVSVVTVALPGGLTTVVRLPTETSTLVVGPDGSVTGMWVVPWGILVGIVMVVPGVPGITTSTEGTVLMSVVGRGGDAGRVTPAGTTIVDVRDDTTGECCKVTGTTTVDVEDVTIGEGCTVIGNTVFNVEDDRRGAG
jgi:hypothetical protein